MKPNPSVKRTCLWQAAYLKRWAFRSVRCGQYYGLASILLLILLLDGCGIAAIGAASIGEKSGDADIKRHEANKNFLETLTRDAVDGDIWSQIAIAVNSIDGHPYFKRFSKNESIDVLRRFSQSSDVSAARYSAFILASFLAGISIYDGTPLPDASVRVPRDIQQARDLLTELATSGCTLQDGYKETHYVWNACTQMANTYVIKGHEDGTQALMWFLYGLNNGTPVGRNFFFGTYLSEEWNKQRRLAKTLREGCFRRSKTELYSLSELNEDLEKLKENASVKFRAQIPIPSIISCEIKGR